MKKLFLIFFPLFSFAQEPEKLLSDEEVELKILRQWIGSKRLITTKEYGGNLSLSGDLRIGFLSARNRYLEMTDRDLSPTELRTRFSVDFSLLLDYYISNRDQSSVKVTYNNAMGLFGGTSNSLVMERCFIATNIFINEEAYLTASAGRRVLGYIFDSRVAYNAFMDGLLIEYGYHCDHCNIQVQGGSILIESAPFDAGIVMEISLLDILKNGLYTKYSLTKWGFRDMLPFFTHQLLSGWKSFLLEKPLHLYAAFLGNADKKENNFGCYCGISLGSLSRVNEWVVDLNFQYIENNVIAPFDFSGTKIDNKDSISTECKFLYLLMKNFTLYAYFKGSLAVNSTYAAYEELGGSCIYAW